jgi:purine-nucleoside phosphorylase
MTIDRIDESAQFVSAFFEDEMPKTAIILGSGLSALADQIEDRIAIPYSRIPHYAQSTAEGHKSNLIIGKLGGKAVIAMQGRFHYYEGYSMDQVTLPVRMMARMGVKYLFVSNAAGAVNPDFKVGDMMVITDHINLMPNPLIGPNMKEFGPRFPDMTTAYSPRLRRIAQTEADKLGITLRQGVYVAGTGPTYETPAEYRMYRILGGDAAGMSTVPEVIVARHCSMEVFGMSIITNQSNELDENTFNDSSDVVIQANHATEKMTSLFRSIISNL